MTTKVKYIADNVVTVDQIDLSTLSTSNVSEGTNLYYTDARVGAYLTANSYATQSYVGTELANLVDSSPATLDTLNELAAALGDDPNFATTVTNSIATKLPLSGGTLTGTLNAQTIIPDNLYVKHTGVTAGVASTDINQIQIGDYLYLQHTSYVNAPVISVNARLTESDYIGAPVGGAADLNKWSPIYAAGGFVIQQGDASGNFGIATGPWNSATSLNNIDPLLTSTYRRLYIDSLGRVTFGSGSSATDSRGGTATKLLVKMDTSQEYLDIQAVSTSANSSLLFSDGSTGAYGAVQYLHANDSMQIYTNSSPRITITSAGLVGVGTSTPSHGITLDDTNYNTSATRRITIKSANHGANAGYRFELESADGTLRSAGYYFEPGNYDTDTYLGLSADDANYQMVVTRGGNVGIGTTSPLNPLHVKQSGGTHLAILETSYSTDRAGRGQLSWRDASDVTGAIWTEYDGSQVSMRFGNLYNSGYTTNTSMIIRGGGNVGIGTTSPPSRLAVVEGTNYSPPGLGNSGGHFGIYKYDAFSGGDYGIMWGVQNTGDVWQQVQRRDGTASAYHLLLQPSGGKVGIRTTDPRSSLSVIGSISGINGDTDLATHTYSSYASLVSSGFIEFTIGYSGTLASGRVFTFTYEATSWKSFFVEIGLASTDGFGVFKAGGYNNGSTSGKSLYEEDANSIATIDWTNSGQHNVITLTFSKTQIHPVFHIKYYQSGGDGAPLMDRAKWVIS